MIQQSQPIVPPQPADKTLRDFSQIIQGSLSALYLAAHVHKVVMTDPAPNQGSVGDVYLVDSATKYIAVKFPSGWQKVALTSV